MLNSALSFRGMAMAVALIAGMAVIGNASALSKKDKHTIAGAVVGGIAGHMLSDGDPAATLAGAAAGGAIGHVATSNRHDRRYDNRYDRRYDNRYDRRHDRSYNRSHGNERHHDRRSQRGHHDNRNRDRNHHGR